jgi:AcrR family transcriptional regulator
MICSLRRSAAGGSRHRPPGRWRSERHTMANSVAKRREEKIAGIVASAWALARADGIAGVTLHGLAREVGMRQPSLYVYFDSKLALYDAMFADGNRQLLERMDALALSAEPREALKQWLHAFAAFGSEDGERYQLLFHRPIPGFTPSAESYALAGKVLGGAYALMQAAGVTEQGDMDCIVAVTAGVTDAQISNDPGGDRWLRQLNHLVDLVADDAIARGRTK